MTILNNLIKLADKMDQEGKLDLADDLDKTIISLAAKKDILEMSDEDFDKLLQSLVTKEIKKRKPKKKEKITKEEPSPEETHYYDQPRDEEIAEILKTLPTPLPEKQPAILKEEPFVTPEPLKPPTMLGLAEVVKHELIKMAEQYKQNGKNIIAAEIEKILIKTATKQDTMPKTSAKRMEMKRGTLEELTGLPFKPDVSAVQITKVDDKYMLSFCGSIRFANVGDFPQLDIFFDSRAMESKTASQNIEPGDDSEVKMIFDLAKKLNTKSNLDDIRAAVKKQYPSVNPNMPLKQLWEKICNGK